VQCLYCGNALAIMRILANGSFCCDEHRDLYESEHSPAPPSGIQPISKPVARRVPPPRRVILSPLDARRRSPQIDLASKRSDGQSGAKMPDVLAGRVKSIIPASRRFRTALKTNLTNVAARFDPLPPSTPPRAPSTNVDWPPLAAKVALRFETTAKKQRRKATRALAAPVSAAATPLIPKLTFELARTGKPRPMDEVSDSPSEDTPEKPDSLSFDLSTQRLREIWRRAPSDLKLIAMVIPMILLLTLNAAGPRLYTKPIAIKLASQPMFDGLLSRQWNAIRRTIAKRAGFDYTDDFHSGLDKWTFNGPVTWGYDSMGFIRPTGLGLFKPTMRASDYHVEFTTRVDDHGIGFAFRATDASNYQAFRLVMTRGGASPEWHLVRYTVLGGRETSRIDKRLPVSPPPEKFFNVTLEVTGKDFTLMVLDKVADFWSDDRLKTGGIGFFCGKGEQARVRHVEVTYQNDALGRFCAFIGSDNTDNNDGS